VRKPGWAAIIAFALASACSEATGVVERSLPIGEVSRSEYPDSGEYNPALVSVAVDAIAWFTGAGQPKGAAQTLFANANSTKQTLTMSVYVDGQEVLTTSPKVKGFQQFTPYTGTLSDTTTAAVTYACGATATSTANSEAEIRMMVNSTTWVGFGKKEDSDNGNGYMNPCPPPPVNCYLSRILSPMSGGILATYEECQGGEAPTPPTGGMGEDGNEVCYTVWREYWELDLSNGTWEFLYEEPIGSVCYQNGYMT
jgi:hypothetical protein